MRCNSFKLRCNFQVHLWFNILTWFGVHKPRSHFCSNFSRWIAVTYFSSRKLRCHRRKFQDRLEHNNIKYISWVLGKWDQKGHTKLNGVKHKKSLISQTVDTKLSWFETGLLNAFRCLKEKNHWYIINHICFMFRQTILFEYFKI